METNVDSGNINALWLENIYENLKNLEKMERIAREGCSSVFEYLQYSPQDRKVMVGDIQYRNLSLMFTEFELLLTDLVPVVNGEKHEFYLRIIKPFQKIIKHRDMFVSERKLLNGSISATVTTDEFWKVLDVLSDLRRDIIKEISPILYVKEDVKKKKW